MNPLLIIDVPISDLKYDDKNARKHNARNLATIRESLTRFGQRKPVVALVNNMVIAGNGTLEVAKELGWTHLSVAYCPADWTLTQARAYALADNRTSELGEWDVDNLADIIASFEDSEINIADLGFAPEEIREMMPEQKKEIVQDEVPEVPEVATSKLGDVYQLGDHRLICGDSTDAATFDTLMEDKRAHMIFTDPPWNVNYGAVEKGNAQGYTLRSIMNDHMNDSDWDIFVGGFSKTLKDYSLDGAMIYLVMSAQEWGVVDKHLQTVGFHWSSTIIWAKDRLVMSRKDYHTQYEPIWYGWNDGAARIKPLKDRKQTDLWQIDRPSRSDLHPTTKPIELVARAITNSSNEGDIVLDAFGGSGSTLIACEQTGRACRMVELDPKYADVIVTRWENLTGKKAVLLNP